MPFFFQISAKGRARRAQRFHNDSGSRKDGRRGMLAALAAPEVLESRQLMAVLQGVDTNDFYMQLQRNPTDPPNPQWNMEKISANITWGVYTGNPKNVVAVMDYGLDFDHADFASSQTQRGQLWDNGQIHSSINSLYKFSKRGYDEYHNSNADNATPPLPTEFWGNHAGGIIGAATNNVMGVAGVNWRIQLYSSKIVETNDTSLEIIRRAVEHLKYLRADPRNRDQHFVRAVAFGYSSVKDYGNPFPRPYLAELGSGIALDFNAPEKGILVAVADGDNDQTWPAKYLSPPNFKPDNIICVGASDENDMPWVGNAVPDAIDIYAPGVNIWSLAEGGTTDSYEKITGTREAEAHVAGAISIIYDAATQHGRTLTYHEVREAIIQGGDIVPGLDKPRLNIAGSLSYLGLSERPDPNDAYKTTLSISDGSQVEGNAGLTYVRMNLTLGKAIPIASTVVCRVSNGTAQVADGDYNSPSASGVVSVVIPAGERVGTLLVAIKGDVKIEPNETLTVSIVSALASLQISKRKATWTIVNDDLPPTISVKNISVVEGTSTLPQAIGKARVFAFLSSQTDQAVTVRFNVFNGTATKTEPATTITPQIRGDFRMPAGAGMFVFAPRSLSAYVDIPVEMDAIAEPDEAFKLILSNPVNGSLVASGNEATVTILDDDKIKISISPVVSSASGSSSNMLFTVSLSRLPTLLEGVITVNFETSSGTGSKAALAGIDFTSTSGTLSFTPSDSLQKTIQVVILPRRLNTRYPKDFSILLKEISGPGTLGPGILQKSSIGRIS